VIKKKIQSIKIDKVAYDEFIIVLKAKNKELRERNNSEIAILSMDLQKLRDKKEEYYDKKFTSEMSEDELKIFKKKNVKIFY
jgi:kynurenine formamidase